MTLVAQTVETGLAELKVKAIQLIAACNDEHVLAELLKYFDKYEADEKQIARRQFEEFDQQYSLVLKRLAQ